MDMVELNEKAMEAAIDAAEATYERHEEAGAFVAAVKAAVTVYSSALPEEVVFCPQCGWNSAMDGKVLPAPDDELVEKLRYRVENPSAWDSFDQGGSDLCREAVTALQSKDEQIERLTRENTELQAARNENAKLRGQRDASLAHTKSLDQQVQKLTAENERLREATKESSRLLKDLNLGRSIHNSRFPQQNIDGPLWDQIPRICEIARSALETHEGRNKQ